MRIGNRKPFLILLMSVNCGDHFGEKFSGARWSWWCLAFRPRCLSGRYVLPMCTETLPPWGSQQPCLSQWRSRNHLHVSEWGEGARESQRIQFSFIQSVWPQWSHSSCSTDNGNGRGQLCVLSFRDYQLEAVMPLTDSMGQTIHNSSSTLILYSYS